MPTPWVRAVQETGQLTVFPGPAFTAAPAWGMGLFTRILTEFNRLATTGRFGVRLVQGSQAPDAKGGGANVQLEVSSGSHSFFDFSGKTQQGTLNAAPGNIKGVTHKIVAGSPQLKVIRAFVFVPLNPTLGAGQRGVGAGVKMALTLHELLHAAGLNTNDAGHDPPVSPSDLYMSGGVLMPGSTPDLDKIIYSQAQPDSLGQFTLTSRTIGQVQDIWLLGQF